MPERHSLPSLEFWRESPARRSQRYYVAFCLFVAAIQDILLGQRERTNDNLNWAATCSYYGLVHAGRFFSFVALGDYPKKHFDLRRLYVSAGSTAPATEPPAYPFDWLRGFTRQRPVPGQSRNAAYLQLIVQYWLSLGLVDAGEMLSAFGRCLASAAELRNDSNYESLIIAHEHDHGLVTPTFVALVDVLIRIGDSTLDRVTQAFDLFARFDPDIGADGDQYSAFLSRRLIPFVNDAVGQKLRGHPELEERLAGITSRADHGDQGGDFTTVEQHASFELFGSKARLMHDFKARVESLERGARELEPDA